MVLALPPCRCGHEKALHHEGHCHSSVSGPPYAMVFACDCTRYQPAPRATRRVKRKDYKRGRGYENDTAEAFPGGQRVGGVGKPDVVIYDPNGTGGDELMCIECEETKTAHLSKGRVDKHAQAERLAKGRRGAPIPAYAFRRKLGPGVESPDWVLMKRENLVKLFERLAGIE